MLGLCSVLNFLTIIITFSSFLDEKTFTKLNLPIYMSVRVSAMLMVGCPSVKSRCSTKTDRPHRDFSC